MSFLEDCVEADIDIRSFPYMTEYGKSGAWENSYDEYFATLTTNIYQRKKFKFSMGIMCRSRNSIQNHNAYVFIHRFTESIKRFNAQTVADKDAFVEKCKVEAYKAMCEIAKFEEEFVGRFDVYDLYRTVCTDFAILIITPTYRCCVVCGNSWVVIHHDVNTFPQRPKFSPISIPYSKEIEQDLLVDMHDKITIDVAKKHFRSFVNVRDLDVSVDPTLMAVANRRFLKMFHSKPTEFTKEITDFIGCMMLKNYNSFEFWVNKNQPDVSAKNNVMLMW